MNPSTVTLPRLSRRWQRLILIGGGLTVFLWLRLEDHGVATAVTMGLLVATLALTGWLWPRLAGRLFRPGQLALAAVLTGAGLGLLTAFSAAALMLLKTGFHGHLNPDYPAGVMAGTLARAPAWALAGGLLGLAAALVWLAANRLRPAAAAAAPEAAPGPD